MISTINLARNLKFNSDKSYLQGTNPKQRLMSEKEVAAQLLIIKKTGLALAITGSDNAHPIGGPLEIIDPTGEHPELLLEYKIIVGAPDPDGAGDVGGGDPLAVRGVPGDGGLVSVLGVDSDLEGAVKSSENSAGKKDVELGLPDPSCTVQLTPALLSLSPEKEGFLHTYSANEMEFLAGNNSGGINLSTQFTNLFRLQQGITQLPFLSGLDQPAGGMYQFETGIDQYVAGATNHLRAKPFETGNDQFWSGNNGFAADLPGYASSTSGLL
nr:dof zinc finger protein DOF3.6-like isoform X2 [Ipomoea batatas]